MPNLDVNVFEHTSHWNGFSPVWVRMWFTILALWLKDLQQTSHRYGF
jgi:hypothetical protein